MTAAIVDLLTVIANERDRQHGADWKHCVEGGQIKGLLGEAEFQRVFGLPMDFQLRRGGDSGIDFWLPLYYSVDVKTAHKPDYLIQEQGKATADIYVLAEYRGPDQLPKLLGWEWGSILRATSCRDFGYGILNHHIPRDRLQSIEYLLKRATKSGR